MTSFSREETSSSPAKVVLVEDNPDDRLFFRRGIKAAELDWEVTEFYDGSIYEELRHIRADLFFVDLKLPKRSGVELIHRLREDPRFLSKPILVLSGSASESDVIRARAAGCSSYFVKPDSLGEYTRILREVDSYWFNPHLIYPSALLRS